MFHCIKAFVLKKGYREKSHCCLLVAFKELYVKTGEMNKEFADNLEMCMDIRQEADYGLSYTGESARIAVEDADQLVKAAERILY